MINEESALEILTLCKEQQTVCTFVRGRVSVEHQYAYKQTAARQVTETGRSGSEASSHAKSIKEQSTENIRALTTIRMSGRLHRFAVKSTLLSSMSAAPLMRRAQSMPTLCWHWLPNKEIYEKTATNTLLGIRNFVTSRKSGGGDRKLGKCLTRLGLLHATTLRATSSLSRYWAMLVLAVKTTQGQGNQDGRNTAEPDKTKRLSATAFALHNLQSVVGDFHAKAIHDGHQTSLLQDVHCCSAPAS